VTTPLPSPPTDTEIRALYETVGKQIYDAILQVVEARATTAGPEPAVILAALTRVTATVGRDLCGLSPSVLANYLKTVAERPDLLVLLTTPDLETSMPDIALPHIAADRDFRQCVEECDKLLTVKGHDYTQGAAGDEGRLKNFYTSGEKLGLPPMQVLGVYMNKHLDAIFTFISKGRVESEPIEGRIEDAVNYLLLLYKLVAHEKRKAERAAATGAPGESR
jgi:hypothetical protein